MTGPRLSLVPENVLVTGGCGFIGTNFLRLLLYGKREFSGRIVNVDKLTLTGNPVNLRDIERDFGADRYVFIHGDICDGPSMADLVDRFAIDAIVHFAAESHVDRSIVDPGAFIRANFQGTFALLEAARKGLSKRPIRFHHVSTDEVFGSLGPNGAFSERSQYDPRSPYSATKAASDHLVRTWFHTYGLPTTISSCSNNYGPFQFPEKLIPFMVLNMLEQKPLPVYGDGLHVRDWLHVNDHCEAVWQILCRGRAGETFVVGGDNEVQNIDLVRLLCQVFADLTETSAAEHEARIRFVEDRPSHDRRYAIDAARIREELGWKPAMTDFTAGLRETVQWYLEHREWIELIRSGDYLSWIATNYSHRR